MRRPPFKEDSMQALGALIGAVIVSFILAYPVFHFPPLFWVFLLVGGLPGLLLGLHGDSKRRAAEYRESRADRRQRSLNAAIVTAAALRAEEPADQRIVNIDARQVHYQREG
jgi:MFS family permease